MLPEVTSRSQEEGSSGEHTEEQSSRHDHPHLSCPRKQGPGRGLLGPINLGCQVSPSALTVSEATETWMLGGHSLGHTRWLKATVAPSSILQGDVTSDTSYTEYVSNMLTSIRRPENPESKQKSRITAPPLQSCRYKTVNGVPGCVEGGQLFLRVTFPEKGSGQKPELRG